MKAVDRVMIAYCRPHRLTEAEAELLRKELSSFIDELLERKLPASKGPLPKAAN